MYSKLILHTVRKRLYRTAAARRSLLYLDRNFASASVSSARPSLLPSSPPHDEAKQWQRREFHCSVVLLDDDEQMSEKEKEQALKATKANADVEAPAEQEEDAATEETKALQEKLAAKKAAAAAATGEQEATPAEGGENAPATEPEPTSTESAAEPEPTPTETSEEEDTKKVDSSPAYSTDELAEDAVRHKAGLEDPDRPFYQNPLHHNNPEMSKVFREDFDSDEEFEAATVPAPPLDLGDGVAAPEYLHAIADEIVHLTMLEMNELVNKIADHYGFHEGMLSPDEDGDAEGDDEDAEEGEVAPQEEAKTSFDIKLVEFDAKAKIKVIKEVRALAGLGLKEAKEMVEGAPKVIHKGMKKEEAEEIKAKLEELGATIEIV